MARILNVPIGFFYDGVPFFPGQVGPNQRERFPIMEFIARGEGLKLSLAFMNIKDAKVRRRVLDLVESLSEGEI